MDVDIDHLRQWIGNTQTDEETLSPTLARQFNATFDREGAPAAGDVAPLLIHFCLTAPITTASELGPDGHPARGGFLPPVPLPRRMWAGGAFRFHGDIRVGDLVQRHSTITDVVLKQGRTGPLCFVTVEHEITSDGRAAVSERQDIVYRDAPSADASAAQTPQTPAPAGTYSRMITPDAPLLFRYSAMTFNGHRIHYDKPYATQVEGYPGLIVHGPMQATLLCQTAADQHGAAPQTFAFRSLSPLFDDADFSVNATREGEEMKLWTARSGGPVAMQATAHW
ncbi:MaoC family dehydratase N-terminal domain-containing protein [Sulfitobacter sp. F26169L]|uniref:FAS1-like dehydratase domain-containing protein n=1 Tax=Sulfitobacter sp. F26169L TaxID=2996015 RepID=UPI002260A313|nr:MaoC family dehydratase N-terminal domain-containing protein [Sulfitobacter sp. F26169L]MCX7568129.1 MaoC family dehydratase N-terminal domain-containing protein [Sulfitobacter sp. F26169L]